ncbi:hypothetical protein KP509_37G000500 [Ceratopteris richardii]|uniref:NADH-ubiquinone oxidoreductase 21kDa subunit N-terminal domain-containing protein n=1 Tax=Ceratopteris richardii TaxID=49495 RepID=A0A8T2Q5T6_CERRI|nr:hypothetical protein KP509_37G000500 [Ceratopteris richardii]
MGIQFEEPKYPILLKDPSISTIYSNFNLTDYLRITTFTFASLVYEYLAGVSCNVRGPSIYIVGCWRLLQSEAAVLLNARVNDQTVDRMREKTLSTAWSVVTRRV